jgi:hypothetical protein
MSIIGVSASTLNGDRTASSDGVDDFGLADGPQTLPENETFGVAMVYRSSDNSNPSHWFGVNDGGQRFEIQDNNFFDSSNGELLVQITASNNSSIAVETQASFVDATSHLVVVNVDSRQGQSGVNIYIDDMAQPGGVSTTAQSGQGFDPTAFSITEEMGFFARNEDSDINSHKALDLPFIEFNSERYSQQDRLELTQRAPGL